MPLKPIFTKIDDSKIQVEQPQLPEIRTYEFEFLKEQRNRIILDATNYQLAKQNELDEVDALIVAAVALGIKDKEMPVNLIKP